MWDGTHLDGVKQTELAARGVVEVVFPLVERLQTIHHGPIVAIRRRCDEEEENPAVEVNQPVQLVSRCLK